MVLPVYAEDEINLADFPANLATQLGIDTFSAGILASALLLMLFMMPVFLITRNPSAHIIVAGIVMALDIALGWLPIWIFAILILLIAFGFANMMSKTLGGRG